MRVKILRNLAKDELEKAAREIYAVSQAAYEPAMAKQYDVDYFREQILNPESINIVARDEDGVIYAHLLAVPYMEAYKELCQYDTVMHMDLENEIMYVESIASIGHNSILKHLVNELLREAHRLGKKEIAMHIRKSTGLSDIIMTYYPVECIRILYNWFGYGEPFDYLEGKLSDVRWLK